MNKKKQRMESLTDQRFGKPRWSVDNSPHTQVYSLNTVIFSASSILMLCCGKIC